MPALKNQRGRKKRWPLLPAPTVKHQGVWEIHGGSKGQYGGGGIKGVKRVHSSSGTVKKKRKVLWEDVFKNRTQEIGKKDSRTRSYTVNLYPSPLCLRKQVVKNAQWAMGLPAPTTGRCAMTWSSHRNRSILNRAGPKSTSQLPAWSHHTRCPVLLALLGDRNGGGGADANSLQAQQSCQEPWEDQHWGQGSVH